MLDPIKLTPEVAARICGKPWRCRMCGEHFVVSVAGNPNVCLKCGNDDPSVEQRIETVQETTTINSQTK